MRTYLYSVNKSTFLTEGKKYELKGDVVYSLDPTKPIALFTVVGNLIYPTAINTMAIPGQPYYYIKENMVYPSTGHPNTISITPELKIVQEE